MKRQSRISIKIKSCREQRRAGRSLHRWMPLATSSRKPSCKATSTNKQTAGLRKAAPGYILKSFWKTERNEAQETPPDLELGDPHAVGPDGHCDLVPDWLLRKRLRKSDPAPVDGTWPGEGDGWPRGIAHNFHPMAFSASHPQRIGHPRQRTGGDETFLLRGRGASGASDRFFLGPKGIAERSAD